MSCRCAAEPFLPMWYGCAAIPVPIPENRQICAPVLLRRARSVRCDRPLTVWLCGTPKEQIWKWKNTPLFKKKVDDAVRMSEKHILSTLFWTRVWLVMWRVTHPPPPPLPHWLKLFFFLCLINGHYSEEKIKVEVGLLRYLSLYFLDLYPIYQFYSSAKWWSVIKTLIFYLFPC